MEIFNQDRILVVADHERIIRTCQERNIQAVMTSSLECKTGTNRVPEIASLYWASMYANVQGDESFCYDCRY